MLTGNIIQLREKSSTYEGRLPRYSISLTLLRINNLIIIAALLRFILRIPFLTGQPTASFVSSEGPRTDGSPLQRRVRPSLLYHGAMASASRAGLFPSASLPPLEVSSDEEPPGGMPDYGGVTRAGVTGVTADAGRSGITANGGVVSSSGGGGWGDLW